jgi:predicted secreted hydrolase
MAPRIAALSLLVLAGCTGAPDPDGTPTPGATPTVTPSPTPMIDVCGLVPEGRVSLPADDAVHDAEIEWWYWTGHLEDDHQRWYGFEEVFFLFAYHGAKLMLAQTAVTDIDAATFHYDAQFGQGTVGDVQDGFSLEINGWSAVGGDGEDTLHGATSSDTLDLSLSAVKVPVLQDGDGYTEYSFGGYTYYYSREHMAARGTLTIGDESRPVTGKAWFDHQWGDLSSAVDVGWDWYALQLDDDREIMLYIMHTEGAPTLVGGSISDAACRTTGIAPDGFSVEPLGSWTSPASGCTYPMGWKITVGDLHLTIDPVMEDQELVSSEQTYWEGASIVSGDATGRAYVELNGYCPGTGPE